MSIGESWGYDRFTRVSNLYKRGLVSKNDNLEMKIQISWLNYNEGISRMNEAIQIRKAIIAENKHKIEMLRENQNNNKKMKKSKIIRYVSHRNQQLLRDNRDLLSQNSARTSK